MLTTLDCDGTESTVIASRSPGTDSVAVSPVRSISSTSTGRASARRSRRASTRSASVTSPSPSRNGPCSSRWTKPALSSVASSREAVLGLTPIRRASSLTPRSCSLSRSTSSSASARATEATGRPPVAPSATVLRFALPLSSMPPMSFVLTCPHCGVREVADFAFGGELSSRPREAPSLRELSQYNYFRRNVAGVQREWWYHRSGCRTWFQAERDTRTNRVLRVGLPGELGGSGGEVGGSGGEISGSGPGGDAA